MPGCVFHSIPEAPAGLRPSTGSPTSLPLPLDASWNQLPKKLLAFKYLPQDLLWEKPKVGQQLRLSQVTCLCRLAGPQLTAHPAWI